MLAFTTFKFREGCSAERRSRRPRHQSLPVRCGRAKAGLLAHVMVAKYCEYPPLHR